MGKEGPKDIYQLLKPVPIDRKEIQTTNALRLLLLKHHIPVNTWQDHELPKLFDEWRRRRDCELVTLGSELFRKTHPTYVTVKMHIDGAVLYLHEDKRFELDDLGTCTGKEKSIRHTLPGSLGEKAKVGEYPTAACLRGISEELGITMHPDQLKFLNMDMAFVPSPEKYAGLTTRRQSSYFECDLTKPQYKPNGTIVFPPGSNEKFAYMDRDRDSRTLTLWRWSTDQVSRPHAK